MGKIYCKIDMEKVEKIINQKGFYFICTKVLYPDFVGPKYIIVSDDLDITVKHPKTKGMIIVSTDKFKSMAEEYNRFFGNEDREKHRYSKYHNIEGYSEEIIEDENGEHQLNPLDIEAHPVEDLIDQRETENEVQKAMKKLTDKQKRRIKMFYYEQLTEREIAKIEGVQRYAVRSSLESAISKMKKIL